MNKKYPSGDLAVWIFIMAELLVFAIFFLAYAITRIDHVELFNTYQSTLDRTSALWNTLALISASYFMVRAVISIKVSQPEKAFKWALVALVMCMVFLTIKTLEFSHHISQGVTLSTNTFYMFYLSLSLFHYMHVWLGLIVLGVIARNIAKGRYSADKCTGAESGANYWHMVDLVWVILFPLVYIM